MDRGCYGWWLEDSWDGEREREQAELGTSITSSPLAIPYFLLETLLSSFTELYALPPLRVEYLMSTDSATCVGV